MAGITSMQNRPKEISPGNWLILAGLYEKPDDIDLFTGGLAEDPKPGEVNGNGHLPQRSNSHRQNLILLPGGLLGPTFSWLIGEQFRYLKAGDRFYFTHAKGENAMGLPESLQVSLGGSKQCLP